MNKIMVAMLVALSASQSMAEPAASRIEYKCHVELIGGEQIIHFVNINAKKSKGIENLILGKKVSPKKASIYKIYECVNSDKDFKTSKAQQMDRTTVR